uniref:Uncharacterized protein n=1 Tax=Avena sativa TaxID=4498 RepID=A0ACD6AJ05_AVESA
MLHIFTVGVKTDLGMIVKSGKKAIAIAIVGTAAPHLAMYAASLALNDWLPKPWIDSFLLTNLTSWWSLSAFIVVCCTLHDLNLLSSKLGRLAMSAALIGDFANTFWIAGVTSYLLSSSPEEKLQRIGFASSVSFSIFIALMGLVARPAILRLIRDVPEGALLPESRLVGVLLITVTCSFAGELLGLHATYGPFMLGLMLPGGAPLGVTLDERLDRLVVGVLTPLLFAQGGMRMDIFTIADVSTCALLEVFLVVGVIAKFVACILPCLYCRITLREASIVGLMMNFKGITEVVYASAFMDAKVLDDQAYAAFMINVLLLGAVSASAVKYMYHPEEKYVANNRRTVEHKKLGDELRVLACVHSQVEVGPMVALLDATSPTPATPLAVYLLHLMPLAGLTSSVRRHFKHGDPNCVPTGSTATESERIVNAFQFFVGQQQEGCSSLLPYVCIAPYATMHDDVCAVALEKRAMLIIQRLNAEEDQLDEEATQDFVRRCVDEHRVLYSQHTVGGSDEMVEVIRNTSMSFNLLVVGRRAESHESPLTAGISDWSEHLELGILGDLLTSTDFGCRVSTLVVQQQTRAAAGEFCQSPEKPGQAQHPPDGPV